MKQKNIKGLISEYFIFLIFIALVVVLTCLKPSFIAPTNLVNILKQEDVHEVGRCDEAGRQACQL